MEILLQLGANSTAFIQFALFIITISILTVFIYGPFFKAYDKRMELTKGADQIASDTVDQAQRLEQVYKARAREISEKIKNIFDVTKAKADSAAGELINKSKEDVAQLSAAASHELQKQKQNAQASVAQISKEVSLEVSKKITGALI